MGSAVELCHCVNGEPSRLGLGLILIHAGSGVRVMIDRRSILILLLASTYLTEPLASSSAASQEIGGDIVILNRSGSVGADVRHGVI